MSGFSLRPLDCPTCGAGIAAGVKWIAREMAKAAQATRLGPEPLKRRAPVTAPRDLGALEYDAKTGVYRPKHRN